jgi:hypothetical protein
MLSQVLKCGAPTAVETDSQEGGVGVSEWEWESLRNRGGVTSNSQTRPVEDAPFHNSQKSGKNKYMVIGPEGAQNQECL